MSFGLTFVIHTIIKSSGLFGWQLVYLQNMIKKQGK